MTSPTPTTHPCEGARALLRHAVRLRRALDAYRREVDRVLGPGLKGDMPF